MKHLVSGPRLPFTAAYFGSIAMTLYFSLVVSQTFILWENFILEFTPSLGVWIRDPAPIPSVVVLMPPYTTEIYTHQCQPLFKTQPVPSYPCPTPRFTSDFSLLPFPPPGFPGSSANPGSQLHSTFFTLISSIVQLVCLLWYLVSYFPMGSQGLRFAARVGGGRVAAWMNN